MYLSVELLCSVSAAFLKTARAAAGDDSGVTSLAYFKVWSMCKGGGVPRDVPADMHHYFSVDMPTGALGWAGDSFPCVQHHKYNWQYQCANSYVNFILGTLGNFQGIVCFAFIKY